ncbi:RPM1-interacting protein 4 [Rhododendron vialii]|uniref:RPM1-interacting protein 4 n=1 Tax=Rhododendron vialii TaxID=182163 RepID=UPI00265FC783|nr:RPM1-interacting protein 4 [Rhododendron vialii]
MAHGSHVPKFGNWEGADNVPYTAYFDKARKGRTGGKIMNPNDPEENPDMFRNTSPPAQSPPPKARAEPEVPKVRGAIRPGHERRVSREDGDLRQFNGSPAHNDNNSRRNSGESAHQRNAGRQVRKSAGSEHSIERSPLHPQYQAKVVQSAGSEHSVERSPMHPHYQAKVARKGSASPGLEGKNSFDSSHGTPGRSRMKPGNRGDETPERGAAVPKFGDWDENNPQSADGYTHIFNKVREEKLMEAGKSPTVGSERAYTAARKQKSDDDMKGCCFPWCRK